MIASKIAQRIRDRLSLGMTDPTVRGDGYEALILREGIVVGRVYLGTVQEIENG